MKLLKIFGLVLALHVVLVPLLFLSPGCQSASRNPSTTTTAPAETNDTSSTAAAPANENWSTQPAASGSNSSQLAPVPVGGTGANDSTLSGLTPAERARGMTPTRPDNPDAYISTTTPAVLAPTQPVAPAGPVNYTVKSGDALISIARRNNTTVSAITRLNPGLKADALRVGQVIKIPASASSASAPAGDAASMTSSAASSSYLVKSGDTLGAIAARNGTTVAALRRANNLRTDVLQIGQMLTIPTATRSPATSGGTTGGAPSAAAPAASSTGGSMEVELKSGDTLSGLAHRYGVTVKQLLDANHITNPRTIRAGQKLVIPGYQAVAGSGAATSPAPSRSATPRPATNPPPASQQQTPPPTTTQPPAQDQSQSPTDLPPGTTDAPVVPVEEPSPAP